MGMNFEIKINGSGDSDFDTLKDNVLGGGSDYSIPSKIYDKIVENKENGMTYFNACWDAYGGNDKKPLSPRAGARLYFIYALADVWGSLHDGERIDPQKSGALYKRVAAYKGDPDLFTYSPETSPVFQNSMAADFSLSSIANSVLTNLNVYNTAIMGVLTFISFAGVVGDNIKKSARLDYIEAAKNTLVLCKNARVAHKLVTMGLSILYAVGDVVGVNSRILFDDVSDGGVIINGIFGRLAELYRASNTTEQTRGKIKEIAIELNSFNTEFIYNYDLFCKIREDVKEKDCKFTRYLGNGFIDIELNAYKNEIEALYKGRKACDAYVDFLDDIQDLQ